MNLRTAIFLIPPHEVQSVAMPIRTKYWLDSQLRIPGHISILSSFVSYKELPEATRTLQNLCAAIDPFEITLDGYDTFPGYTFMKISNPEPVQELFEKIVTIFPECLPYEGKYGTELHPHLTVAKFTSENEQRSVQLPAYAPITFRVDKLHIMYTNSEVTLPWISYEVLSFGTIHIDD